MRIYQPIPLNINDIIEIDVPASHHLSNVLRVRTGDTITLFNGKGGEFTSIITKITKKNVIVEIQAFLNINRESPLSLTLAQGISRGEKMDFTIQKAVELGVSKIVPLQTERCNVKLDEERQLKRQQHWQKVAIHACEQCMRNIVPEVLSPISLDKWLAKDHSNSINLILDPKALFSLSDLKRSMLNHNEIKESFQSIILMIGPEGGLTDKEMQRAELKDYKGIQLGPRILRTETAAISALTALQCYFGDLDFNR